MRELKRAKAIYDKLYFILSPQQRKLAMLVFFMSIIAALLEMVGVSIILPIMEVMLNSKEIADKWYISPFVGIFNLDSSIKLAWFVCCLAIVVYVAKNLYFIFYNWVSLKFSYKVNRELSSRILRAYMRQGYLFFVNNNSARLLQGIGADVSSVYSILIEIFNMMTKLLTILSISVFILIQSKETAFILIALGVVCLAVIQLIFRKSMRINGKIKRDISWQCTKTSIEAIQGNKEILVMNKQDYFVDNYAKMLARLNRISIKVDMGTRSPSYIIEMICICGLLSVIVFQMGSTEDMNGLISRLSTIAIAAFRILPALGGVSSGINTITMSMPQLSEAYNTLCEVKQLEEYDAGEEVKQTKYKDVRFEREVEIRDLVFRYPNAQNNVIDHVNLTIKKGESVAFIGPSGAGKTTLSDIVLALLKPNGGCILMDGIDIEELGSEWNRVIGYVPQMVYIVDDTIKHNIAFGEDISRVADERVWQALKMAQLDEFVKSLPDTLNTIVGEHGIRFSGGQRQRLAIARALYRNPEILVLDEATAALDNETEEAVMDSIESLQGYKTLIIIAHRLTTVKDCDAIYEVRDGGITKKSKAEIYSDIRSGHAR